MAFLFFPALKHQSMTSMNAAVLRTHATVIWTHVRLESITDHLPSGKQVSWSLIPWNFKEWEGNNIPDEVTSQRFQKAARKF